jgi:hypothetical protein
MQDAPSARGRRFRCPLCGGKTYSAVEITLKNGTTVKADFYHCTECTLHFVHPERFIRAEFDRTESESPKPRSPDRVLYRDLTGGERGIRTLDTGFARITP